MLFRRQRHIEVIGAFTQRDFARFVQGPEDRQAPMSQVIAAGPVVDEADDVVSQLAVLENLVGDEPAELARAGDENPLEPDACPPPPLQSASRT